MPKVSVVIPLYNKEKHVGRAVNSVLAQTVHDFEMVIVDDGSTDKSVDMLEPILDPRIRLIRQVNAGVSVARNRGISEARAELIAFLDADDAWNPLFLETVLRLQEKFPQAGIYATSYEVVLLSGKKIRPLFRAIPYPPWEGLIPNYLESASGVPPVWTSAVMIPRRVLEVCGPFAVGEKLGEDLDMWFRIAEKYRVSFSNAYCGAIYYMNSSNRSYASGLTLDNFFIKKLKDRISCEATLDEDRAHLKRYVTKKYIEAALFHLQAGDLCRSRAMLRDCEANCFRWRKFLIFWISLLPSRFVSMLFSIRDRLRF